MILYRVVNINNLFEKGKKFRWKRPIGCLRCGHFKVWKHGFVVRYFEEFANKIFVRRYRCPECSCIYTMRPKGYWRRFWSVSSKKIIRSIRKKLITGKWLTEMPRQRQQYWYKGFKKQCIRSGYGINKYTLILLEELILAGTIPATHSLTHFKNNL